MADAGVGLVLRGVGKAFAGIPALRDIDLEFRAGEIHGLIGENGAGKSTLINIATGVLRPDSGEIRLDGTIVPPGRPVEARRRGIHVVHQESDQFAELSIAENMGMANGLARNRGGLIDWREVDRRARRGLQELDVRMDVRQSAGSVSVGMRTLAEIAGAIQSHPRVLFLDEPTASLGVEESQALMAHLRRFRDAGVAVILVSHRLEEVLAVCDRITTLRDGQLVSTTVAAGQTVSDLVAGMVGRAVDLGSPRPPADYPPRWEIRGPGGALAIGAGEVVGLYGLVGAGRSEFAQRALGIVPGPEAIYRDGVTASAEVAYLPEDRLTQGIFATHSCTANVSVAALRQWPGGWIAPSRERGLANRTVASLNVKLASIGQPISTLSGGNQQKLVMGRWLAVSPQLLILDEPTRGVDIGAKAQIHREIIELANGGMSILLISSDLPEVRALADRVCVMREGKIGAEFDPRVSEEAAIVAAALPADARPDPTQVTPPVAPNRRWPRELGTLVAVIAVAMALGVSRPGEFLTVKNLLDVLTAASLTAIAAVGVSLVIIAGAIDISIGRMLGLVGAIAGMAAMAGVRPGGALGLAVAVGALLGSANALLTFGRIHSIVVTLATANLFYGLMLQLTQGRDVNPLPDGYRRLADGSIGPAPTLVVWAGLVVIGGAVLLNRTRLGRQILAVGNSERAVSRIGISPFRMRVAAFAIMGGLIGLASALWGGYYGKIQANTGAGFELQAIAAAVVGGCSISGGRGSAVGAALGAILIAMIRNGLVLLQIDPYLQDFFVGGMILAAVLVDTLARRKLEAK